MSSVKVIIQDALILFAVSTAFVLGTKFAFSFLEDKEIKDDPLVTAVLQEKPEALEKILSTDKKHKFSTSLSDAQGRTALMRASFANYSTQKKTLEADKKHAPMVKTLIAHGAPIDQQDKDGWTALMWASWSGMPRVVEELLKANASVILTGNKGFTALSLAAVRGNANIVKQLLDHGADANEPTSTGQTPLQLAQEQRGYYLSNKEKKQNYEKTIRYLKGHPVTQKDD